MICFIALFVFGVLGIFSATHRKIAFEAFDCVFRKMTLRKCETGLDTRLKSDLVGKLLRFSPHAGRFVFKHFQIISWIFTIVMVWSIIATGIGAYNYYMYGNCNGPQSENFCIFDPTGANSKVSEVQQSCSAGAEVKHNLTVEGVNLALFQRYNIGAKNKVVFIGCYSCEYTREAYPNIKKLWDRNDVEFTFAHFPVKSHSQELGKIGDCVYVINSSKFREFNDRMFEMNLSQITDTEEIMKIVTDLGFNRTEMDLCVNSSEIISLSQKQFDEIQKTGIYGTPLVFVNGEPVVGPKPYRVYSRLLK